MYCNYDITLSIDNPPANSYHFLHHSRIDEKDVTYTPEPGHSGGFGAIVGRIGRGHPRSVACGRDYTVVCTWPYQGPAMEIAAKLMEEAKIRVVEALMQNQAEEGSVESS